MAAKKKVFKCLPDGRKRRAKSDCNGLKRTRGAIEAAQTEWWSCPFVGSKMMENAGMSALWEKVERESWDFRKEIVSKFKQSLEASIWSDIFSLTGTWIPDFSQCIAKLHPGLQKRGTASYVLNGGLGHLSCRQPKLVPIRLRRPARISWTEVCCKCGVCFLARLLCVLKVFHLGTVAASFYYSWHMTLSLHTQALQDPVELLTFVLWPRLEMIHVCPSQAD